MNTMSLYQLDDAMAQLIERGFTTDCVNEDGELDEGKIQEYLTNLPIERDKKLEAYGCLIKNLTAEANAIREEEKTLATRRQTKEKTIERLKDNISASMQLMSQSKFETSKVVFSFRKSESVEVADVETLPEEYVTTKVTKAADKTALKQALKSGLTIDGVQLVEKQNLQVK